jgi:hypothetical protein
VIDDMAREFSLDGMCHMLAMAIHEMTGWDLGVVERRHPSSGEWGWCHLGVWCPTGYPNFLDIKGRREPEEVIADAEQFGGPVRVQVPVSLAHWHAIVGAPASWWRTLFVNDWDGRWEATTEQFARILVAAAS